VFEWNEQSKAGINFSRHGVRMPEAIPVFDDPCAITIADDESDPDEQRFVTLGMGAGGPSARGRLRLRCREHPDHFRSSRGTA